MSDNSRSNHASWSLAFTYRVGTVVPADNHHDYTRFLPKKLYRPNGVKLTIGPGHGNLWKLLVMISNDLSQSPAKSWMTQSKLCQLCCTSRSDLRQKLRDLEDLGLVYVQRRGTTSNMIYIFFDHYTPGQTPALEPKPIIFDSSSFVQTNAPPRSRTLNDLAEHTDVLVATLKERFPDHPSVSNASQLKYLASNLQAGVQTVGSALKFSHLILSATDDSYPERVPIYEKVLACKNLGGYLSKCAAGWLDKYGDEADAEMSSFEETSSPDLDEPDF